MGSRKKATVGYRYYMGLHFGICHGPVDAVEEITVGERTAWSGSQTASGSLSINSGELFGGDKREGGVAGTLDVMMGESTQGANSYLVSKLGAVIPAFRGILSAVWRGGQVSANNPYVKPWAFRVKRILQGWTGGTAWYPEKAVIGDSETIVIGSEYNLADTFPALIYGQPGYPGFGGTYPATLTVGPFSEDAEIISGKIDGSLPATPDDRFVFNGVEDSRAQTSGTIIYSLTSGDSLIIGIKNIWDYGCGASGYFHIKKTTTILGGEMNPAHIVYQCLTDTSWGMGYPTSAIDTASFSAAADALYAEGFGLSLLWNRQEVIENFVALVLDHIGGLLYVRPDTSTFGLKLIRADYDRGSLPQYGPENLIAAEDYQRQAWGETINEITVVYTDSSSGKAASTTVHDQANIITQGAIVANTMEYPGITNASLAQRVALRDLQSVSTPLAKIRLTATRAAWAVFPGDVFRLTWPEYGIDDVVYRALGVNLGTLTDGKIIIDAVEDVFGLPGNTYLVDQPSEWEDPTSEPAPAPYRALLEAPYWDLVRNLSAADMAYVDNLSGYLETLATRPSSDATNYGIAARTGSGDYTMRGNGDFCPTATISGALTKTATALTLANGVDLDLVEVGGYAVIDGEYVLVSALDATAGTATIARGLLDTVPVSHADGVRIWFADGWQGFDTTEAVDGETVDVKLLPLTGRGELAIADAPVNSITFDQRQYRPYPPAKVRFDSLEWPGTIEGATDVVLTWAHRDRTLQTAYLVTQDESSIGPEAGVTYSIEVTDESLAVLHSATGISSATATVPSSSLTAGLLRFRLWSVRGGLSSWQIHEHWAAWGDVRTTESGEVRITEAGESRVID